MQKIDLLIVILAGLANISIALLVYLKNKQHLAHRLFLLLVGSLVFWMITNYLSVTLTDPASIFVAVKLVLASVVLQTTFFYLFASVFPGTNLTIGRKHARIYLGISLIVFAVALYPGFFSDYEVRGDSIYPRPSPLIGVFMIHTAFSIFCGLTRLFIRLRQAKGINKVHFKYLILASIAILIISPITNFILPVAAEITVFLPFGPIYSFVFASVIGYSMVRHKLFDFRSVLVKALGYLFSIGLAGVFYVSAVFGVSSLFFLETEISTRITVIYGLLAVILAFSFNSIHQFFDKYTNKIFFRDAYDPQEFLDTLNKNIVSNIELGILLRRTTSIIQENLKSGFCQIAIHETENTTMRVIGTENATYTIEELIVVHDQIQQVGKKRVSAEDTKDFKELGGFYAKYGIDLIVHLTTSSYGDQKTIAYIIFGAKKSGNIYNIQDLRIIDIIADELVIAIQNALRFEEIQEFNVTLQKKVNDATSKLRKTNEKLKSMDETKDEFISMASHQLRTPLTSVKGYLSMVLEGDAGEVNPGQKKLLDQAFVSSQRMVYLIADLLNVSRLRTGKFIIDTAPTNLADVVESEVAQLIEQAKAKGQTFTYDKPADFPGLMLDETKIRQVIMNFADNALFYTPSGGKIKIELTQDKSHVYFAVKDNGIGVPKEEQKHMFTKFYRAKNARNARPDGTGLGLFMAKKVITAQGGNLLFESVEGKGSTFGFSFNKKHLSPDEKPAEDQSETDKQPA